MVLLVPVVLLVPLVPGFYWFYWFYWFHWFLWFYWCHQLVNRLPLGDHTVKYLRRLEYKLSSIKVSPSTRKWVAKRNASRKCWLVSPFGQGDFNEATQVVGWRQIDGQFSTCLESRNESLAVWRLIKMWMALRLSQQTRKEPPLRASHGDRKKLTARDGERHKIPLDTHLKLNIKLQLIWPKFNHSASRGTSQNLYSGLTCSQHFPRYLIPRRVIVLIVLARHTFPAIFTRRTRSLTIGGKPQINRP